MRLPEFTGWGYSKDIPKPAVETFHERWEKLEQTSIPDIRKTGSIRAVTEPLEPLTNKSKQSSNLVNQFAEELTAIGGSFLLCHSQDLGPRILALIREKQVSEILAWEDRHFPPGLLEYLRQAGVQVKHDLDASVQIGLTGAIAAVAETGTLIVPGGPGKPNFPSLTTEVHLAVLRKEDVHQRLVDVLDLTELRTAPTVAMISGPSRTADIELTLTIGVHGPREVHVYCYEG